MKKFVRKSSYEKICTQKCARNCLHETVCSKQMYENSILRISLLENRVGNIPVGWPKSRFEILCAGLSRKWNNYIYIYIYKAIKSVQAHNIQLSTCQEWRNSKAVYFSDSTSLITYPQLFCFFLQKSFFPEKMGLSSLKNQIPGQRPLIPKRDLPTLLKIVPRLTSMKKFAHYSLYCYEPMSCQLGKPCTNE